MTDATEAAPSASPLAPIDSFPDPKDAPALRWGILAAGGIARRFAADVPKYTASTIAAVGSRSAERAAAFAADFGIPRSHGSYEDLVADPDVDAIYVASPHSEHRDHAILALEAGKPVLVEKAITRNAAEAREIFDVAAARGLFAMEAMWARFLPHYRSVVEAVSAGAIGEVISLTALHGQHLVRGPEHRLWNPELAGGALLDLGVYPVSFAHAVLGVPDEIHAYGELSDLGIDRAETVVMRYGQRIIAVAVSSLETGMLNNATIAGTTGRIDLDRTFYNPTDVNLSTHDGGAWSLPGRLAGGFQFQAAEAARRIHAGETSSPLMTWQASVEVMEMMDEIRRQVGVVYPGE